MQSQRRAGREWSAIGEAALVMTERVARLILEGRKGIGDFVGLAKIAFVRAAIARAREAGEHGTPNAARIATETGLSREEVGAILKQPASPSVTSRRGQARADQVLRGWWEDRAFQDARGRPAALRMRGPVPSLVSLVKRHALGAGRAAPIVNELLRAQAIKKRADGRYVATKKTCVNVQWDADSLRNLGTEISRHFDALHHNLAQRSEVPKFARVAHSDGFDVKRAGVLMTQLTRDADNLLEGAKLSFSAQRKARARVKIKNAAPPARRIVLQVQLVEEPCLPNISAGAAEKRSRRNRKAGRRRSGPSGVGAT